MAKVTMNGERVELFVPLAKFDERTGEFEGWASVEELDRHGEICDIEKSWPALATMAQEQAEISNGKSVGVLRRQHRRDSSVGKLTLIERRKHGESDGVYVKGKVTDEQAKADAAEGVLTGLSLRGLASRWDDETVKGVKRYAWTLGEETSLVDRPAVPHALIEVMKASGEIEMVKAVGRQVAQYWDCEMPGCMSKHSRKEEAQKCDAPEPQAEDIPQRIEATEKSADAPAVTKTKQVESGLLLEKCLSCAANIANLIQIVTAERQPRVCTCAASPCCCYTDPGHEPIDDAAVQKLWDSLRALVNSERAKWMQEEGVPDDGSYDVGKMLDAITARLRDTKVINEAMKSLRVPAGNGSLNRHKEGTMEVKKEEEKKGQEAPPATSGEGTGDGELAKSLAALQKQVAELAARFDAQSKGDGEDTAKALGTIGTQLAAITTRIDEITKPNPDFDELKKSVEDLGKAFEALVASLPQSRKGQLRSVPVRKEDETSEAKKDADAPVDPWTNPAYRIAAFR